jgi:hypothetical protein
MPLDTPARVVSDIMFDFERRALRPLWLDPFFVIDLTWGDDEAASLRGD